MKINKKAAKKTAKDILILLTVICVGVGLIEVVRITPWVLFILSFVSIIVVGIKIMYEINVRLDDDNKW